MFIPRHETSKQKHTNTHEHKKTAWAHLPDKQQEKQESESYPSKRVPSIKSTHGQFISPLSAPICPPPSPPPYRLINTLHRSNPVRAPPAVRRWNHRRKIKSKNKLKPTLGCSVTAVRPLAAASRQRGTGRVPEPRRRRRVRPPRRAFLTGPSLRSPQR